MRVTSEELKKTVDALHIRFPVAELSEKLGYSRSAVSNYLNGVKIPSESFVEAFKKHYKVDIIRQRGTFITLSLEPSDVQRLCSFLVENKGKLMSDPVFKLVIGELYRYGNQKTSTE